MQKLTELSLQIRYYGTLRFAMLTVFMAATAGLMAAFFGVRTVALFRILLALFGIAATLIFASLQAKLSAVHQGCIDYLKQIAGQHPQVGEEFISILFGHNLSHPFDRRLEELRTWLLKFSLTQYFLPRDSAARFAGPVTLLVLSLHGLAVLLWLTLLLCAPFF
ncbi:hypothetical protein [Geoalkalibacter sp.]|uniref:hypothetical protein n=1 Tax=Geoalkalibacter sp. TaxID=3041440 RepID=UPI00272DEA5F|nr:hypothetical protein [Geoalkalibacter sp.]